MAISYLSKTVTGPVPVDSIDVDGLKQAVFMRQQNHNQQRAAVQSIITAQRTAASELLREDDRKYMTEKIEGLTAQIQNDFGGADFGDQNTIAGINSLVSTAAKDERIRGAMRDSNSIRSLIENINKIKTDPKLMDRYSKSNEDWDMRAVNAYLQTPGSRYNGGSTPTPYVDVDKKLSTAMAKLKDDITLKYGEQGYLKYVKGIGPERINQIITNKLATDPQLRTQLGINQWHRFKDTPDNIVRASYDQYVSGRINGLNANIKELNDRKLAVAGNSEAEKALQSQIDLLKGAQKKISSNRATSVDAMKNHVYMNDLVDGFTSQFSHNEDIVKSDPTYIAKQNMKQRQLEHSDKMTLQSFKIKQDGIWKQASIGLKQQDLALKQEALNLKRELAEAKLNGEGGLGTGRGGSNSITPLPTGFEEGFKPDIQLSEVETEMVNLQNKNKGNVAKMVWELMSYGNPELRSQASQINGLIQSIAAGGTTNAEGLYNKLLDAKPNQVQQAGITVDFKKALKDKGNLIWRNVDRVAMGAPVTNDLRSMNNTNMNALLQDINHNYVGALQLRNQLKNVENQAYGRLNISTEQRAKVDADVARFKSNPSLIPQQDLYVAATEAFGRGGVLGNKPFEAWLQDPKVRARAIERYQQRTLDLDPNDLRSKMGEVLKDGYDIGLARRTYAFPEKVDENVKRALSASLMKLTTESERRAALGNGSVDPIEFAQQGDGSYNLKYRIVTKDQKGKLVSSEPAIQNIPAINKDIIEAHLPKNWGQQAPYHYYQKAIKNEGGLYMPGGKILGLYSEGNFPIPYSIQRYTSDPDDPRVKIVVNKRVGAGSRWVDFPTAPIPNASSAVEYMNKLGNDAYSAGQRNVQDFISGWLNNSNR